MRNQTPSQPHRRFRLPILALSMGSIVLALWFAMPRLLSLYNIEMAGRALAHGLAWPEPRAADALPIRTDDAALDTALAHLAAAQHWRPADDYAYRLAGHAYLARQDWQRAGAAFEQAAQRNPDNPLAHWEATLAYEQQASLPTAPYQARLVAAGLDASTALEAGNTAWDRQDWQGAQRWYRRARTLQPTLPAAVVFRETLWAVATGNATTFSPTLTLEAATGLTIQAETLLWDDGLALAQFGGDDATIGMLWWGRWAVMGLDIRQAGRYRVVVRAAHVQPAPIQLSLGYDLLSEAALEFGRGDGTWAEQSVLLTLPAGRHLFNLRLANDGAIAGQDRNGEVDWIRLEWQES